MDNITCGLCGGVDFYNLAGYYYCNECHTQSQDIREQVLDTHETDLTTVKPGRKFKSKGKLKDEQHITSWECYNYILHGLVNELIQLGAKPELKEIVRIIWFKYLESLEVFSEDPADPPKLAAVYSQTDAEIVYSRKQKRKRSRSRSPASSSDVTTTDTTLRRKERTRQKRALVKAEYDEFTSTQHSEDIISLQNQSLSSLKDSSEQDTKKVLLQFNQKAKKELEALLGKEHLDAHCKDFSNQLKCHKPTYSLVSYAYGHGPEIVSKNKLFAIIYLGLLIIKDKVQLGDLLRFIREGHLSYHKVDHLVPEEAQGKYLRQHFSRMNIQNSQFQLKHNGVRKMAANIAKELGLMKCIPVQNLAELIERYCKELNLPDAIGMSSITLLSVLQPKMKIDSNSKLIPNYEGRAMAFIIFVLKLFFALDDKSELYLSELATKINNLGGNERMFNWKDWMDYIQYRKLIIAQHHFPSHILFDNSNLKNYELFVNFMKQQEDKFESEFKLTTEQEVLQNVLEKLKRKQKDLNPLIDLQPSLTPFCSYVNDILNSEVGSKNGYNLNILKSNFKTSSISFLYSPYSYLRKIYRHSRVGIKHRGVNNNLLLTESVNKAYNRDVKRKVATKPVLTRIFKENHSEEIQEGIVSKDQAIVLQEQTTKIYLKLFEECNLKRFRKNMKRMKKSASLGRHQVPPEFGESSTDYYKPQENEITEDHEVLHYNPFERYWLRIEDVSRNTKSDFEALYKSLPYSFRLLFKECSRILEQSERELFEEFTNMEVYALFINNSDYFSNETILAFGNDRIPTIKDKVAKSW